MSYKSLMMELGKAKLLALALKPVRWKGRPLKDGLAVEEVVAVAVEEVAAVAWEEKEVLLGGNLSAAVARNLLKCGHR